MADETEDELTYEQILLELSPDQICEVIELNSKRIFDGPSRTYVMDAIKEYREKGKPLDVVFEGLGRTMFNAVMIKATLAFIHEMEWKDCWPSKETEEKDEKKEGEDDNPPTDSD